MRASNAQLPAAQQLTCSPETILLGRGSPLDSLGLVRFVLATEQALAEKLGVTISLSDEKALSRARSPFRTIQTLADYIHEQLEAPQHA
jgi:acyl carrier protein